jgi:hypothetical protein
MTKVNEHGSTPQGMTPNRHSSHDAGRAPNDAGGEVPPRNYQISMPQGPKPPQGPVDRGEPDLV